MWDPTTSHLFEFFMMNWQCKFVRDLWHLLVILYDTIKFVKIWALIHL